jgi:hypothetical protein
MSTIIAADAVKTADILTRYFIVGYGKSQRIGIVFALYNPGSLI